MVTLEMTRGFRLICGLALALTAMIALQLLPLPPGLWTGLPGRALLADGMRAAGLEPGWQPLSMVPWLTWNALFSLLIPLAALVLMLRCTPSERLSMLPVLIFAGVACALVGFIQAAAPGSLHFYAITNEEFPVGLFANRNHQAVWLCCLPLMLAGWSAHAGAGKDSGKSTSKGGRGPVLQLGALVLVIALIPLVLVTGSRAGLILYGVSLLLAGAIRFGAARGPISTMFDRRFVILVGGMIIVAVLVALTMMSRDVAAGRLVSGGLDDELRAVVWPRSLDLAWAYFPFGTGFGTFPEVFKIGELQNTLATSYVNHAHSDWVEFLMDGGIVALVILMTGLVAWGNVLVRLVAQRRPHSQWTTTGLTACAMTFVLGLASLADYPMRVPSLMLVGVVAIVWMAQAMSDKSAKRG